MRDFRFDLVTISGSGRIRNSRIAGVVVTPSLPRLSTRTSGSRRMPRPALVGPAQCAPAGAADEVVFAHAEEGEVVVGQPFEEGDRLVDIVGVDRRRRCLGVGAIASFESRHHRRPVRDRDPHFGEQRREAQRQRRARLLAPQPVDMDLHQAFADRRRRRRRGAEIVGEPARRVALDADDRMGHQPDLGAEVVDLAERRSRPGTACCR